MSKMMVKRDGLWTPMENLKGDTGPLPADNSVTNDALVTDGAKTNTAYLMGNRLTKDAEGELISVDDSYPSAALSLTVEGKSTQVQTTGKNLLNPTVAANAGGWLRRRTSNTSYGTIVDSGGTNCNIFLVPLEDGKSLTYSRGNVTKFGFHFVWTTDETLAVGSVLNNIVTLTNYSRRTFTNNTGGTVYVGVAASVNSTTADEGVLENGEGQLEYATAFTSYEPYSGGAASPRPDWPQEIESVIDPLLNVSDDNEPYFGDVAQLQDVTLRSLPDGTKDELYLTYLRPSSREGWAWYAPTLTQRIAKVEIRSFSTIGTNSSRYCVGMTNIGGRYVSAYNAAGDPLRGASNRFKTQQSSGNYVNDGHFVYYSGNGYITFAFANGRFANVAEANAWLAENPTYVHLKLKTPITTTLDPIELPIMQAGTTNIWSDPSTNLSVTYERDRNIVISKLEAAAADLATS